MRQEYFRLLYIFFNNSCLVSSNLIPVPSTISGKEIKIEIVEQLKVCKAIGDIHTPTREGLGPPCPDGAALADLE
jgi:hypothetical protein